MDFNKLLDDKKALELQQPNQLSADEVEEEIDAIQLNECQELAVQDIVGWAYTKGGSSWTLSGAAGTGKTFVTNVILKQIRQSAICVSAPTHKAKKIVGDVTGYHAETLQALLGLAPNQDVEDFDINRAKFDQKNKAKIKNYSFIVIDEASMIGKDLFNLLMKEAKECGCKILFVGDHIQLPPIGEEISPVFIPNQTAGISVLKTPARQKPSNPASMLLIALRIDIDIAQANNLFPYLEIAILLFGGNNTDVLNARNAIRGHGVFRTLINRFPELWNNGEGYKRFTDAVDFADAIKELYSNVNPSDFDYIKMLAFTNKRVSEYNRALRDIVLKNPEKPIVVGDILISYTTISKYPEKSNVVVNSEEYTVVSVEEFETSFGIDVFAVGMETDKGVRTDINIVKEEAYKLFNMTHNVWLDRGKTKRDWVGYYKFKHGHLVMDSLNDIFKTKDLPKKDVDYNYALTVHKSQGSTYTHACIDGNNIREAYTFAKSAKEMEGGWTEKEELNARLFTLRLMYVAFSRAKESVRIILS